MTYEDADLALSKMSLLQVKRTIRRFEMISAAYSDIRVSFVLAVEAELLAIRFNLPENVMESSK